MSNKKHKQPKAKEPVKIRYRQLSNGNQSIYFDIYRNGKRVYEFPKLYIVPERTPADKEQNRQMLEKAIKIKAQRINEITNQENGFTNMGLKQKAIIYDYLQKLAEEKRGTKQSNDSMYKSYQALIYRLQQFSGNKTTFKQVNKEFCIKFIEWLKTAENRVYKKGVSKTFTSGLLSAATQYNYIKVFTVALNRAVSDEIIPGNPFNHLKRNEVPKKPESDREYLTIDEVKQLAKTECINPVIKQAFLFSCFSGLRFSDVKGLTWGDIQTDNDGKTLIHYTQTKTKKNEYLQVSDEALKYLPDKGSAKDKDLVFTLSYNGYSNSVLKSWAWASGINKRVTFHVGRHTNATLLLSLGVPIETVSKLLGHSNIQTTQIYAKVIDKNKRDAVSKLDGLTD